MQLVCYNAILADKVTGYGAQPTAFGLMGKPCQET